jgi:hypothetical protein
MSSAIELEYANVYGTAQKKQETRQRFLSRIVEKVNKTTDDEWDQLTADAQRWFNTAVKAWDKSETVPDFPDADEEDGPEPDEASGEEDRDDDGPAQRRDEREDDMAAKKRAAKRGTAKKAAAPARKKDSNGAVGKVATSGSSIMKRALLKNMQLTDKELVKICKEKDYPLSLGRIQYMRAEFRQTMRILAEDGKLKSPLNF